MLLLLHAIAGGTESAGDTVANAVVWGIALGLLLVGLLGCLSRLALHGL